MHETFKMVIKVIGDLVIKINAKYSWRQLSAISEASPIAYLLMSIYVNHPQYFWELGDTLTESSRKKKDIEEILLLTMIWKIITLLHPWSWSFFHFLMYAWKLYWIFELFNTLRNQVYSKRIYCALPVYKHFLQENFENLAIPENLGTVVHIQ